MSESRTPDKIVNIAFEYPSIIFANEFGCLRSGELVTIASGANQGKTTFVHRLLAKNKSKNVCMINMEFDLQDGFTYEYFRKIGTPEEKIKLKGTDILPLTHEEELGLNQFLEKKHSEVDVIDLSQKSTANEMIKMLVKLRKDGVRLVAIDSLTSIDGVADDLNNQVEVMQRLRNFCTTTGVAVILIHHFNKGGKQYSGSAKIKDLSNVLIEIHPCEDIDDEEYRIFSLKKDKAYGSVKESHVYFVAGEYVEVPESDRGELM